MSAPGSYKISAFAKAADIPLKTLNRHLDRGLINIPGGNPKSGKGHPREFNLSGVYVAAIGHALTRLSVTPTAAMRIAQKFLDPQHGRAAARLFESGRTLLLVQTDGFPSIINLQADQDVSPLIREATIVVDLSKLISTVNSRLFS